MTATILEGDCLKTLKTLPDCSVQCVVTSPPFYGLRDYGTAKWGGGDPACDHSPARKNGSESSTLGGGQATNSHKQEGYSKACLKCGAVRVDDQIGLEETPEAYVEKLVQVFREVRRVLKDDGTLWLNLGDSYASNWGSCRPNRIGNPSRTERQVKMGWGSKEKDLLGIPWAVATALRDPFYAGNIKQERDRVWMAATIDGEGTICGFDFERSDDGSPRTGVNICITNSSMLMINEAMRIWTASRHEHNRPGDGHLGNLQTYRWIVNGIENKLLFLREIYPYLIVKKNQALLAYNLLLLMADAKKLGHTPQRDAVREKRSLIVSLMSDANNMRPYDIPDWCIAPPSVYEPGWYLRQDIIWNKPNPMPESVTDRCTKSHEYIFLLSKSARYYYDNEAIAETVTDSTVARLSQDVENQTGSTRVPGKTNGNMKAVGRAYSFARTVAEDPPPGQPNQHRADREDIEYSGKRNKRDVWTVTTKPYKEAHFATFPPDLIEPCILAGSRDGDTVLDPFNGSGTTGAVSVKHRRNYIGCELNPKYIKLTYKRLSRVQIMAPL